MTVNSRRTPEYLSRICDALRQGASLRAAAASVGRSDGWLRQWRLDDPEVAEAIEIAQADWERGALAYISANEDWKARSWLLARRWPDEYGDRQRVDLVSYDSKEARNAAANILGLDALEDDEP